MSQRNRIAVNVWRRINNDLMDKGPDWCASVQRGIAVSTAVRKNKRKPRRRRN